MIKGLKSIADSVGFPNDALKGLCRVLKRFSFSGPHGKQPLLVDVFVLYRFCRN